MKMNGHWSRRALLLVALAVAGILAAAAAARTTAVPQNTAKPTISGTAREGQTLTASNGTWDNSPTSFKYEWQRCNVDNTGCTTVAGATGKTYTLVSGDVDHRMRVIVTAVNADGQSSAISNTTEVVSSTSAPTNTAKPTISGTPSIGEQLTASTGTWTGGVRTYAYQWQRCTTAAVTVCTSIVGATGKTYGVRAADVDQRLRVVVTATNASGSKASATSDPTAVVTGTTTTTTVVTTTVAGNKPPAISFLSLKRIGTRLYARFRVCDDSYGRIVVIERDNKARTLSYTRKFTVTTSCATFARHWTLIKRFRSSHGKVVVTLRAQDRSGALSRIVSRSVRV